MTSQQVAAWARALVKMDDKERTRIVVKGVKVSADEIGKVRFVHNKVRHFYAAHSNGKSPIRIRFVDDAFVAASNSGEVRVHAKTADVAFAKCAKEAWAS